MSTTDVVHIRCIEVSYIFFLETFRSVESESVAMLFVYSDLYGHTMLGEAQGDLCPAAECSLTANRIEWKFPFLRCKLTDFT